MNKILNALAFAADLAPGAAIAALGVLLILAGVIPGALLQ
jgi:hypothetical protein